MQTMVPLYGFGGVPYSTVRKAAPRNLLDNSDFRNPVNQRGQTSIVVNNDVYTYFIDRWCFVDWSGNDAGTLTLTDGGISVTVEMLNFYQRFEKGVMDLTKSYTLAVCYDDGTIEINKNPLFSESAFDSISFTVMPGKTVSWAALYEGSYTAETLPEYLPKGYGAELAECQRYYQRFFYNQYTTIALGFEGPGYAFIQLSGNNMRLKFPTMTISAPIQIGSRTYMPTGCNINNGTIIIGLNYNTTTTNVGACYAYCPSAGGCVIELNEDL